MIQRHNILPSSAEIQLILSDAGCPNLNDLAPNYKDLYPLSLARRGPQCRSALRADFTITNMPVF